ncbi:LamG-like jellyroll fold domain-containing protein [Actinoplanes subglobosus]|uniref:LamG-like jellyroll fold domain-containing protein n=1 Tax=Actinoplanes subglobosus TaxID=1547892 RepID=A0ABV8IQZ9_9ACTN
MRRALLVVLAGILLAAGPWLWIPAGGAWTAAVSVPATVAASANFPGVPQIVTDGGPVFYHRGEDLQSSSVTSTAADSSGSGQNGTYATPTNGSSMWWRMDDGSGATTFADASGATNTGQHTGSGMTITASPGPTGGAYMLGASSNPTFAQAALSSVLSPFRADRGFTVSVWANLGDTAPTASGTRAAVAHLTNSSYPRSDVALVADHSTNCAAPPCWTFTMAKDPSTLTGVTGWDTVYGPTAVSNTWALVTGVFNAGTGTMTLYVNGTAAATATHTIPVNAATGRNIGFGRYRIAGAWSSYGGRDTGTGMIIGEARTWRRALSAAEVAMLPVRATSRWAFDEASGTPGWTGSASSTGGGTVTARSTTGVTLGSAAALATGRTGNSLSIPAAGANGYLQGPAGQVATNGSFSAGAWVKLTSNSTDRTIISQNGTNTTAFTIGYDQAQNRWAMRFWPSDSAAATPSVTYSAANSVVLNQWTHVAGVYESGSEIRLYVNGRSSGTATAHTTGWASSGAVQIGRRLTGGATVAGWQGQIDDLRIFNGYALVTATLTPLLGGAAVEEFGGLDGTTKTGHAGSTAIAFGGVANGWNGRYSATAAPSAFTVECLVRVAAGDRGVLAGFADTSSGLAGASADRLLYVDTAGKARFGVISGGVPVTVVSAATVSDGAWHHVMGSVGAGGLKLYVDGVRVVDTAVTTSASTTGYWRWGGQPLLPPGGWPSEPPNPYLTGTVDELAAYSRQLTDQENLWRVYANY